MHIMNGSFSRDGGCSFIFLMCLSLVPAHVAVASASEPIVAWFMEWLTITWEVLEPRVASRIGYCLVVLTPWSIWKQRNAIISRNYRNVEHAVLNEIKFAFLSRSSAGGFFGRPIMLCNYILCNTFPVFS